MGVDAQVAAAYSTRPLSSAQLGEVSEWLKEHAWKVCIPQGIEGSNPSLTATNFSFEINVILISKGSIKVIGNGFGNKTGNDGLFVYQLCADGHGVVAANSFLRIKDPAIAQSPGARPARPAVSISHSVSESL
jgi:hypothetical protein